MIWLDLHRVLSTGHPAVLAVVVESDGSAPGKQGFKMVVSASGRVAGTVGGGVMEAGIITRSQTLLTTKATQGHIVPQIHHERAPEDQRSGMICAGRQTLLLQPFYPVDIPKVQTILDCQKTQQSLGLCFSPEGFSLELTPSKTMLSEFNQELDVWSYSEVVGEPDILYIVGGGHVGLAISRIFQHLDFRTVIFDHRSDLEMIRANTAVDEVIIGPYHDLATHIRPGKKSYVAVVSAAFSSDVTALASIRELSLKYVGLMGSKAKIKRIFAELKQQGYDQEQLDKIHAPLGLPIPNRTPAEIAISLAAEIISVRNTP